MFDWIPNLPVVLIALVVLVGMALLTLAVYALVVRLAEGEHGEAIKAFSPSMLPPMGILFALIVGFLAVGVWGNVDRAQDAVSDEASALRSVIILSDELPPDLRSRMRALVRRQIDDAVNEEWPAMEEQRATLSAVPTPLAGALNLAVQFGPQSEPETVTQRELVASLQDALAARRERIVLSESGINTVKWLGLLSLAALALASIGLVHSGNRVTAGIAMGVFALAVAVVITMLAAEDQPFVGQLGIDPDVLEQVVPRGG
jgi:uncharacterized membrane protein (DUF485 family)